MFWTLIADRLPRSTSRLEMGMPDRVFVKLPTHTPSSDKIGRAVTGREKILVFNGCYHGSVDETMVRLIDGKPVNRPGLAGEFRDLTKQAKICEFNEVAALEKAAALAPGDALSGR